MSRATVDIEAARMFLSAGLLNLIQIVLVVIGVGYLLLSLNWRLALLTLAFMPLIFWQTLYVSNRLQPIWLKVQQLIGALGTTLQESLFGIKVVKAFSLAGEGKPQVQRRRRKSVRPAGQRGPPAGGVYAR